MRADGEMRGDGEQIVPWDVRILARIDAGVDGSIIEENLRRTPAERLERHQQMLRFLEETQGRAKDLLDLAELAEIRKRSR
jgi:hypothetical protein